MSPESAQQKGAQLEGWACALDLQTGAWVEVQTEEGEKGEAEEAEAGGAPETCCCPAAKT